MIISWDGSSNNFAVSTYYHYKYIYEREYLSKIEAIGFNCGPDPYYGGKIGSEYNWIDTVKGKKISNFDKRDCYFPEENNYVYNESVKGVNFLTGLKIQRIESHEKCLVMSIQS